MDLQVGIADVVRYVLAPASLGAGWAFAKPFAARYFELWLERVAARQRAENARVEAELEKERAIERIAAIHERTIGVLERVDERLDRIERRQDRMEAHLGVPVGRGESLSPVPDAPTPRRQLTDPNLPPPVDSRRAPLSQPGAQPG
jgi:hypothetical protein